MKIEEFPAFANLNATQVANFLAACTEARYEAGSSIIQQGTRGDAVYFIIQGEARVYIEQGSERTSLATLHAPAVIGEMELLTGEPRTASVDAKSNVEVLLMPFDVLRARIDDGDPGTLKIMYGIARLLAHRLAEMDHRLTRLTEGRPVRREELEAFKRKLFSDWSF